MSQGKTTRFCSIWFDLLESRVCCREADDSNSITATSASDWVSFFLFFDFMYSICKYVCRWREKWQREVKESAGGKTEKWKDQVSGRLNPVWLKCSILYRLNAITASPLYPPFIPPLPLSFSWQRVWNTILGWMIRIGSCLSWLLGFSLCISLPLSSLYHSEGIHQCFYSIKPKGSTCICGSWISISKIST